MKMMMLSFCHKMFCVRAASRWDRSGICWRARVKAKRTRLAVSCSHYQKTMMTSVASTSFLSTMGTGDSQSRPFCLYACSPTYPGPIPATCSPNASMLHNATFPKQQKEAEAWALCQRGISCKEWHPFAFHRLMCTS